jgi:magnesium-transporting ATPase (P-type)
VTTLVAHPSGLTSAEAAALLEKFGRNELPAANSKGLPARALAQLANPLIYVLLCSAGISALLGHAVDTAVIMAVVVINAAIGLVQEGRAEHALAAIRGMIGPRASVRRDGCRTVVPASAVVPGDILLLEAGDRVAADARLVRARNLLIDESILTGESVAVSKTVCSSSRAGASEEDPAFTFSGTLVVAGQGTALVTATGTATQLGRITTLLKRVEEPETPLVQQMNVFARRITAATLGLSVMTFAYAWLLGGYAVADAFMIVVGMAVAAIPEGLPAVTTITMAVGVQRMARRHAILRRLPAIEALGCVTTICSDKTGTLTKNEMTVTKVVTSERQYDVGGVGYAPSGRFNLAGIEVDPGGDPHLMHIIRSAALCSEAALRTADRGWAVDGDPLEGALLVAALKAGFSMDTLHRTCPRLDEIPFDARHRYMASLHSGHDGESTLCVKGAPERLLDMCDRQRGGRGVADIDRAYWTDAVEHLAGGGYRVIAVASKAFPRKDGLAFADVSNLMLEGLIGLIDPPREEAIEAIAQCRNAGITVKMITGDHVVTADAIARQLGIDVSNPPAAGHQLESLDESELRQLVTETNVFARTTPEQKLRLVEALQAEGSIVAMTGDGVNDAPALKRADVGIAMGRNGTEAAKEAAEMVLVDDNFASIVAAIREGRAVYDNLTKVIAWTLPTSGGETLIIVLAILFGLTLPITPVQVLWVNTVSAVGLGLVLAFEPAEPDIMRRRPRAETEQLLSNFLVWRVFLVSALFAAGAFGVFEWALYRGLNIETARTMVVNAIVVMSIAYLFAVRYLRSTSLTWRGALGTPAVLLGVGGVTMMQLAFTYLAPMNRAFETRPVSLEAGVAVILVGVLFLVALEVEKRLQRRYGTFVERVLTALAQVLRGRWQAIGRTARISPKA